MEKTKKPTKKDHFNTLLGMSEVQNNAEIVSFINHELELLNRKNSADKKPTANQIANAGYQTAILDYMEPGKKYTISELMKEVPELSELANQKVTSLVRGLKDEGVIVRTEDKRKAYFSLAD